MPRTEETESVRNRLVHRVIGDWKDSSWSGYNEKSVRPADQRRAAPVGKKDTAGASHNKTHPITFPRLIAQSID